MSDHILWSAANAAFYNPTISSCIPDDAVPVSRARYDALMAEAGEHGAPIIADAKGRPRVQRADARQRRADLRAAIRGEARRRCFAASAQWRQLNDLRAPSEAGARRFARIDAIRAASALIEQDLAESDAAALASFPVSTHPLWPDTASAG